MRIGIVADIHDEVKLLTNASTRLREMEADQIVTLGDAFDSFRTGETAAEIAVLLQEAGAIGVWGNHDVGLSHEVTAEIRDQADPAVLAFAARLQTQLVLGEYRFSHEEPWKDPCRLEDLWRFDGVPGTAEKAQLCFGAVPERILFVGHFHTWMVMHPEGRVEWDGRRPIKLVESERYLILVAAVAEGWCGVFETEESELTPIGCFD